VSEGSKVEISPQCGLYSANSKQGQMAGFCELGDKTFDSVKVAE